MSASKGGGFRFRVGGWYRFPGINSGNLAYIFQEHDREMKSSNAVWLPIGTTCQIPAGQAASDNAFEVPDDEVTDKMWSALGRWALTGKTS